MYLLLDLSTRDLIHLALFDEHHRTDKEVSGLNRDLLAAVDDFLTEQKLQKDDIKGIMSVVGTGSFTSTRIGTVVANAFGFVQKIPLLAIRKEQTGDIQSLISTLLAQPAGQYISATYSGEPNITTK